MRIVPRRLLAITAVVVLVAAAAVLALHQATQQIPDFYRRALAAPPTAQQANGQRFEEQALVLQNQLHHAGRWEVCFTESQINGWLAAELPAKFPHALPAGVSEPRVSMEHGRLQLAIHYQRGGIDTVVSLLGQVYLTDQPNELAIQINQARAGMLPVPLGKFLQEISERAARSNVALSWTEQQGSPVALVRVPAELDETGRRRLTLEKLQFGNGTLVVAGRTERRAEPMKSLEAPATAVQPGESEIRQR